MKKMFFILISLSFLLMGSLKAGTIENAMEIAGNRLKSPQVKKMAMTWKQLRHDPQLGIALVGCSSSDPRQGDTPVEAKLPVLAIKKSNLPRPNYAVDGQAHAMEKEFYRGWSGGYIKLTPPIKGSSLTSLKAANDYCRQTCGEGYQMAEFHDGFFYPGMDKNTYYGATWPDRNRLEQGGWFFWANGDVGNNSRFWVYINDQRANCWDQ
jgi:hypothetical protein